MPLPGCWWFSWAERLHRPDPVVTPWTGRTEPNPGRSRQSSPKPWVRLTVILDPLPPQSTKARCVSNDTGAMLNRW